MGVKKVLIINYEFPPLGGGGGVAAYDLAIEWAKTARVDVITSSYKGLPAHEEINNIHVYRVKIFFRKSRDAASFLSMLSYIPFGFIKGLALCKKNRYDVMNTHFAVPSGPLGYVLGKMFKIPNVLSLHGGDIYEPSRKTSPHRHFFFKRVVRFILNKADVIVAQSTNTRDNALHYFKPNKEIYVIPLAFHPPNLPKSMMKKPVFEKSEFALVTIGRLIKRKAIDVMIESMRLVKEKKIKLYIIGDGPEKSFLEDLVCRYGLQSRIIFLGYVDEMDKYRYISASKIFISTSLHEGFGIVFMESMFFGLPIICANNGGHLDFLKNEENALIIDVGDSEACAHAIGRYYSDKKLYKRCSSNNKIKVKEFYAVSIANRYMQIFNEVSGVSGKRS